ncbi:OsmC family protein [Nonomuraea soli]|uniref:Putative OsmC-like protein n=1 Tax=Nonomuraea soli TaxID=1032476 RepID=A0A7W0CF90_9ACTN|nr:OsmC family protein [Nonomuraea soli]MBA2890026.1 putative OsmC-like protein [Nonomuraea soli]
MSENIEVLWQGGDSFDIDIRDHVVRTDQPRLDSGPTPVELFVGALASCVALYAVRYLRRRQLPSGLSVTARYEMADNPQRVGRIDLEVHAPGLPPGLRRSFEAVIEHCTVHNSLRQPAEVGFTILASGDQEAVPV